VQGFIYFILEQDPQVKVNCMGSDLQRQLQSPAYYSVTKNTLNCLQCLQTGVRIYIILVELKAHYTPTLALWNGTW